MRGEEPVTRSRQPSARDNLHERPDYNHASGAVLLCTGPCCASASTNSVLPSDAYNGCAFKRCIELSARRGNGRGP